MEKHKIAFVNPRIEIRDSFFDNPAFCMTGMLYAASEAKAEGHIVDVLDSFLEGEVRSNVRRYKDKYHIIGTDPDTMAKRVSEKDPDIVIVNYSDFHREIKLVSRSLKRLMELISSPDRKIILANFHLSECMKYFNFSEDDVMAALPEIDSIMNGYFSDSSLGCGKDEDSIRDFQDFGLIDPEMVDYHRYQEFFNEMSTKGLVKEHETGERIFPMFTSRGCNFRCFFCSSKKGIWKPLNMHHIEKNIITAKANGVSKIFVLDLLANMDRDRFGQILETIIKNGMKVHFSNGLRIDLLNEKTIRYLSECTDILSVSIESGDQSVVDRIIKKNLDLEKAEYNAGLISKYKIRCYAHYMTHSPGESESEIRKTEEMARRFEKDYGIVSRIQPYVPASAENGFDGQGNNIISKRFTLAEKEI